MLRTMHQKTARVDLLIAPASRDQWDDLAGRLGVSRTRMLETAVDALDRLIDSGVIERLPITLPDNKKSRPVSPAGRLSNTGSPTQATKSQESKEVVPAL
jgi:hypothetical protein